MRQVKNKKAVKNNKNSKGAEKNSSSPSKSASKEKGRSKRPAPPKSKAKNVASSEEDEDGAEEKDEESEDEPLAKKAKPTPPTVSDFCSNLRHDYELLFLFGLFQDDEIKSYVKEILDEANLEEITMKTVCKEVYAKYPQFDLSNKKDFIKQTVKSVSIHLTIYENYLTVFSKWTNRKSVY